MLKTFALRGRELPLDVYGPRGLVDLLGSLRRVIGKLTYDLELTELDPGTCSSATVIASRPSQ